MAIKGFGHEDQYEYRGTTAISALRSRTNTFFLNWSPAKGKVKTVVCMLDDEPYGVFRHRLYVAGKENWPKRMIKITCADSDSSDMNGRKCRVCNRMLIDKRIGRQFFSYLSLIDEEGFTTKEGKEFKFWKYLLEMSHEHYEKFGEKKDTYGSLVGMRFKAFRPKVKTSDTIGDWTPLDRGEPVDLKEHVWDSPAVGRIIEASERSDDGVLSEEEAVEKIIAPVNYDDEIMNYSKQNADLFLALLDGNIAEMDGVATTKSADDIDYSTEDEPKTVNTSDVSSVRKRNKSKAAKAGRAKRKSPPPVEDPSNAKAPKRSKGWKDKKKSKQKAGAGSQSRTTRRGRNPPF